MPKKKINNPIEGYQMTDANKIKLNQAREKAVINAANHMSKV